MTRVDPLAADSIGTVEPSGVSGSVAAAGRMRPAMVLHVLNSPAGGAALSTLSIIERLAAEGIASCAVCHDAGSPIERKQLLDATSGRTVFRPLYWWNRKIRAPRWKRPLIELRQILKTGWARQSAATVAQYAQWNRAQLIHTNTFLNPEGGLAARALGLPHVWHLRELIGPGQPFQFPQSNAQLRRFIERHTSIVVANSHITAAQAGSALPRELLRVVPNGIDVDAFQPRIADRNCAPIVVAMVASLTSRWKKHALFVAAAERLKDLPNIEFRIYGHDTTEGGTRPRDDYAEQIHRQIVAAGLENRFHIPGHIADPTQIMSQIDILAHAADSESFGRVLVEAMAAGLPVVSVRGGGASEVVEDGVTGLLVAPDDACGLSNCLRRMVTDCGLRERLGQAGRQRALQNYSLQACVAGVLRAYEDAMLRSRGQTAAHERQRQSLNIESGSDSNGSE